MKRAFLNARPFCLTILFGLFLSAQSLAQAPNPKLAKVSKVTTLVVADSKGSPPNGISEARLRTLLELRLRTAGLRVLTEDEDARDLETNPYVLLSVGTLATTTQAGRSIGFAYRVDLSIRIVGKVPLNGSVATFLLFTDGTMGVAPDDNARSTIEKEVGDLTDSLLNQWLKDNPKR